MGEALSSAVAHDSLAHAPAPRQVSKPHDPDEREAQRVAETVTRGGSVAGWSFSSIPVAPDSAVQHARTCGCGGTCPECRRARLNRSSRSSGAAPSTGTAHVDGAVRTVGRPLSKSARAFFEPRLNADLSDVRVHTDAAAARSADALDAHAYALGSHVVFGEGEYRPDSEAGRRLLAHELAHVVQQERSGERIQRDEKDKPARVDIAVVLDGSEISLRAAQQLAPKVVRAYDVDDIKTALTSAGAPIGTLYVVSHANAGQVQFESKIGTISWKKLSEIGAALKGVLPADKSPQVVDFRGCQAGGATEELGRFREATGAKAAKGSNCFTFDDVEGPITLGDVEITSPGQVTEQNRANFETGLRRLIAQTKSPDGHSVKDCILGLGRGETADRNLEKIKARYFMGKGSIAAEWASPQDDPKWQAGSICFKDMTATSTPCHVATQTAMNEPADEGSERASAPEPGGGDREAVA
jgi:hypothetical protein